MYQTLIFLRDVANSKDTRRVRELYSTANDPQLQMIPRPQMIPKVDLKNDPAKEK